MIDDIIIRFMNIISISTVINNISTSINNIRNAINNISSDVNNTRNATNNNRNTINNCTHKYLSTFEVKHNKMFVYHLH